MKTSLSNYEQMMFDRNSN